MIFENFSVESNCFIDIVYDEGEFRPNGVNVEINEANYEIIENIYEYLEELKYINISVYAKSD